MNSTTNASNPERGARNLLKHCAKMKPGQRLLLVGEAGSASYFEPGLCRIVAEVAQGMGVTAQILTAPPVSGAERFPRDIAAAMRGVDATVFFSRLGDQVRFLATPGAGKKIMCYAVTAKHLGAPFATVHHAKMARIHDLLKRRILSSSHYQLSAPCGTRLRGEIRHGPGPDDPPATSEFRVDLFPVMIFPPLNCHRVFGNLVLKNFLLSTSTRAYANSVLRINSAINIAIEDSRMVQFEGDAGEVTTVQRQMERAAKITGGDPYALNSWHTGINPGTFFEGDPYDDLEYWGTAAFGSPKFTHFHACGRDPGDVAIHLMDASIAFDDEPLWENGGFAFLDSPQAQGVLSAAEKEKLRAGSLLGTGF